MMLAHALALGAGGRVPTLALPSGFTFPAAYTPAIRGSSAGGYSASIDAHAFVDPRVWTGPAYYVDVTAGNDANTGLSWAQAVKGIWKAVQLGNATAAPFRVYVKAGSYNRANSILGTANTYSTQDVAFIADSGRVISGPWDDLSWAPDATQTNTYSVTLANGERCIDLLNPDGSGDCPDLTKVADAATCNATPGSWTIAGGKAYVRRADGAAVTNANTRIFRTAFNLRLDATSKSVYLEGFDLQGGYTGNIEAITSVTRNVVGVECSFKYSGGSASLNDAVRIDNMPGLALFVRCTTACSAKDGFNAHYTTATADTAYMVTLDCIGRNNGRYTSVSNNGLTLHESVKGIDVNGAYGGNFGTNVYIVGSAQLWAVGTDALNSQGDTSLGGTFPPTDFQTGNTSQMWVEGTTATGSTRSLRADDTSVIRKRNHTSAGTETAGPSASISTY